MIKEFKEDFKNYLLKSKSFILIVLIFLLLSFGIRLISNSISIDTELYMIAAGELEASWQGMGRWGLVLLNKLIMGNLFIIPFSNLLTFINILTYSILINFLLYSLLNDKNKQLFTKYQFILTAIFITSPIFAEQYGFTLQNASVSFSIVLTSLSLIAFNYYLKSSDKKRNVCILIICVIATILSFAVYQAIVPFYIAMVIICYYLKITNAKSKNNEWKYLFSNICFFLISIVFYYIIAEILSTNVTYLKFGWVENGLSLTFKYLHDVINKMLSCETIFYNVSYLLSLLLLPVIFISNIIKKKINFGYILALSGILVSPYLLMIFTGVDQLYRTQFNYSFIIGFIFLLCFLDLINYKSKVCKIFCFGLLVLSVGFGLRQSILSSSIYYSDQIRYEKDLTIAENTQTEIEKQAWFNVNNLSEFKIIFLGKNNTNNIDIKVNEVIGASFFEFDYPNYYGINNRAYAFMKIRGYNYMPSTKKDFKKAKEFTGKNDENKFITKTDNIIIVRLSEEFI